MLTILITYLDHTTDIRDCLDVSDICLDGVYDIRILRDERTSRAA
jgi:hypothetical protein